MQKKRKTTLVEVRSRTWLATKTNERGENDYKLTWESEPTTAERRFLKQDGKEAK